MRTITTTFSEDGTVTLDDPGRNVHLRVRPYGHGVLDLTLAPLDGETPLNGSVLSAIGDMVATVQALAAIGDEGGTPTPGEDEPADSGDAAAATWPVGARPSVDEFADHFRRLGGDVAALAEFFGVDADRIYAWTRNARGAKPPRLPRARATAR